MQLFEQPHNEPNNETEVCFEKGLKEQLRSHAVKCDTSCSYTHCRELSLGGQMSLVLEERDVGLLKTVFR